MLHFFFSYLLLCIAFHLQFLLQQIQLLYLDLKECVKKLKVVFKLHLIKDGLKWNNVFLKVKICLFRKDNNHLHFYRHYNYNWWLYFYMDTLCCNTFCLSISRKRLCCPTIGYFSLCLYCQNISNMDSNALHWYIDSISITFC